MKTTIDLPDELIRQAKLRAVIEGRTLKELIADFMRQGLGLEAAPKPLAVSASKMVVVDDFGFPTVQCSADPPASLMSIEELLRLDQQSQTEEDIHRAGLSI